MFEINTTGRKTGGCDCYKCQSSPEDILRDIPVYQGPNSALLNAVPQSIFEDIDRLPKALQANARITFTPHGTDIGPKYGVKDYFRQISSTQIGKNAACLKIIMPSYSAKRPTIGIMMNLLEDLQKRYVYEINVDSHKHHHRPHGEIVSLSPIALSMTVFKENDAYQEQVAMLTTEHIQIRRKDAEHINTMLPYGFTEHALKRLWERASLDGDTFHELMADGFRILRDRIAMAYIAYTGEGLDVPDYLAIPFNDGLLIAGKRSCWTHSIQRRYGYKVSHTGIELLSSGATFFSEACATDTGAQHVGSVDWLVGTYMHAHDISNHDRTDAAEEYEQWAENLSEGIMPYLCERFQPASRQEIDQWLPTGERKRFIQLQERMQPRMDPRDERVYLFGDVNLDEAQDLAKNNGRLPGPKNLPY